MVKKCDSIPDCTAKFIGCNINYRCPTQAKPWGLAVSKSQICTHRQTSTSWSSSGQLHSYRSLQLAWLWFISSPRVLMESAPSESHTLWNWRTLAASPYTCLARWCSLKCVTGKCIYVNVCIIWRAKCKIFGTMKVRTCYDPSNIITHKNLIFNIVPHHAVC